MRDEDRRLVKRGGEATLLAGMSKLRVKSAVPNLLARPGRN
jgi:hypothetical protein